MNKIDITQPKFLNAPVPVLPAGLNRLLRAFEAEYINHLKLAEIIADFPSIAARLIFLANSAWASPRVPIENLETACARLGLSMVRSVSISLCIVSPFDAVNRCPAFDIEYFWCSTLLTAEGATMLAAAPDTSALNISTVHTAGLLHNLGLLWLAGNWPQETSQALKLAAANDSMTTLEALRSELGADYCEAGGILARAWKLPEILVSAMEQHCHCKYPESAFLSTVLVGYAAEMVSALQLGREQRPQFPAQAPVNFKPDYLDGIYRKLRDNLTKTQELAHTMFSSY